MSALSPEDAVRQARGDTTAAMVAEPGPGGHMVTVVEPDGSGVSRYFVDDGGVYRVPNHCSGPAAFVDAYPTSESRTSLLVEGT